MMYIFYHLTTLLILDYHSQFLQESHKLELLIMLSVVILTNVFVAIIMATWDEIGEEIDAINCVLFIS